MLDGLTKWLNVAQVIDALKATIVQNAWKVIITYAKALKIRAPDWLHIDSMYMYSLTHSPH